MIISEKQIHELITIAHTHMANVYIMNEYKRYNEIQDLLTEINNQQSEELREIE